MSSAAKDLAKSENSNKKNICASADTLRSIYDNIVSACITNPNLIILIGASGRGKTTLLKKITKDLASTNRLVYLHGEDFSSQEKLDNTNEAVNNKIHEFNILKEFIFESTELEEQHLIIIDNADSLPDEILEDIFIFYSKFSNKQRGINLILAGLPELETRLEKYWDFSNKDVSLHTLDILDVDDVRELILINESLNNLENAPIHFDSDTVSTLCNYINNDQQVLDVILQWCAATIEADDIDKVSSKTLAKAINFAEQFAKDHDISITESFPPSKISDLQDTGSDKNKEEETEHPDAAEEIESYPEYEQLSIDTDVENKQDTSAVQIENDVDPPTLIEQVFEEDETDTKKVYVLSVIILFAAIGLVFLASTFKQELSKDAEVIVGSRPVPIIENEAENQDSASSVEQESSTSRLATPSSNEFQTNQPNNTEKIAVPAKAEGITTNIVPSENLPAIKDETTSENLAVEEINNNIVQPEYLSANEEESIKDRLDVEALLATAQHQYTTKKLTTPTDDNALATYQQILEQDQNNEAAKRGIDDIYARYVSWANFDVKNGQIRRAKYFYRKALEIKPNDKVAKEKLSNLDQQQSNNKNALQQITSQDDMNDKEVDAGTIDLLLLKAKRQIDNKFLTTPSNNNAFATYQLILEHDPENSIALHGLEIIKNSYINWAEKDITEKNYRRAINNLEKALQVDPEDALILERLEEIKQQSGMYN